MKASLLYESQDILGEGPHWHAGRNSFFWVDILDKTLHEYKWPEGNVKQWALDHRASLVIENQQQQIMLGLQDGVASFDPVAGHIELLCDIERDMAVNRSNDGACDAAGRLWIGTMHCQCEPGCGSLYSVDHNMSVRKHLSGLGIPNGIVWSQDGQRMYFIDTQSQTVQCFLFDIGTGNIKFEKVAISIEEKYGSPDGMCMDEEGMVWIAHWGGFGVYRWDPLTGQMIDKIELPVPQVSSCAFGGSGMDHLFITTAKENMSDSDLKKYPHSGDIFIATPGVRGIPVHKFGKK